MYDMIKHGLASTGLKYMDIFTYTELVLCKTLERTEKVLRFFHFFTMYLLIYNLTCMRYEVYVSRQPHAVPFIQLFIHQ